ncbi:hypothetical protein [Neobacillus sp. PS3-40]|uniref:hypothetical protein n=1 Tax=Neobacillus sp. PS3-40 TaxID=3070679 RepID=UPI0027DEF71E|nr:hypothetical protein [Neobacillus sp. PS3-40]WML45452.1 hypothetical protein RCG20_05995 [Neobacillus sp. PS3-40]
MKKLDKNYTALSLLICILIPFVIPSKYFIEGMSRYKYGFPFPYITIYQNKPNSIWFGNNFFTGNAGLLINPLTFILNLIIIYLIMGFIVNKFKSRKVKPQ